MSAQQAVRFGIQTCRAHHEHCRAFSAATYLLTALFFSLLYSPSLLPDASTESWLKAVPGCHAAISEFKATVDAKTAAAVEDYSRAIAALEQQRTQLMKEADAYLTSLLAQGQQVLQRVNAHAAQQQQPAQVAAPAQGLQYAQPQQPHQQQQPQPLPQLQQRHSSGAIQQEPTSPDDVQVAVEQLLLSHTRQKRRGASAAGQIPAVNKRSRSLLESQEAAGGQVLAGGAAASAALPFPMGPAAKWLQPSVQA